MQRIIDRMSLTREIQEPQMNSISKIACISLLIVHATNCFAEERRAELKKLIAELAKATWSHEAEESYRALFAACGQSELSALRRSEDDSIAIQAAWREIALTIPEENGPQVYRPDKDKLRWFLGFLEGRGRIDSPKWWAEIVADMRAHRRSNIFSREWAGNPYHEAGVKFVRAPHGTTIKKDGNDYLLTIGGDSVKLPDEILEKSDDGELSGNFSGYFTPKRCFVAVHNDVGYQHTVACIDRSTGELVWRAKACGCFWGGATGIHESRVSVTLHEDRVVVFGAAHTGFYAHAFRAEDGKTIFRFSSGFSD
jgi:hypothetical protein